MVRRGRVTEQMPVDMRLGLLAIRGFARDQVAILSGSLDTYAVLVMEKAEAIVARVDELLS
jgi:hypothetical protein